MHPLIPQDVSAWQYAEFLAELPIISMLGCFFAFAFQPARSRTFLKKCSRRTILLIRLAVPLAISGIITRICLANAGFVPLLLGMLLAGLAGLAIGCGVIYLMRRWCPAFLQMRMSWWMFAPLAAFFLFLAAWSGWDGQWKAASISGALGALELWAMVAVWRANRVGHASSAAGS